VEEERGGDRPASHPSDRPCGRDVAETGGPSRLAS
jgi:hypothetical protein